mmetsp:Transcript_62848/g.146329  ORF Transcript_62848/g.146329 Transcript_62848/m.146329 type:complete len:286 (-) Transcript_62848:310-1167(-)
MSPSHQTSLPSASSCAEKVSVTPSADISQENDSSERMTSSTSGPSAHCIELPSMVPIHSPSVLTHRPPKASALPAGLRSSTSSEASRGSSHACCEADARHRVGFEGMAASSDGGGSEFLSYGTKFGSLTTFMPAPLKSRTCQAPSRCATKTPVAPFSSVRFSRLRSRTLTPRAKYKMAVSSGSSSPGDGPVGSRTGSEAATGTFDGTWDGFSAALMTFKEKMRATSFLSTPPLIAASRAAFISALSPEAAADASRSNSPECFCCSLLRAASNSSNSFCATRVPSL